MGYKCCVPYCQGNYKSQQGMEVHMFRFPKCDELRNRWIAAIPRKDFVPTRHTRETLRLFPTVPVPIALLKEDTPLDGGRYIAPRSSYVSVALFLLHRQPHLFPDPEKFDPGRFMGEDCLRHPYSYLPFGAGSRRCVGARFATLEMKTVLATVLRRFRMLPVTTREELDNVIVSIGGLPAHGCKVKCLRRDNLPSCKAK